MDTQDTSTPVASEDLKATPGAKMIYLIKRKPSTSHEELVAHWFANHMPEVIRAQHELAAKDKLHAWRYIATLFNANSKGLHPWDGMAQLWWDKALWRPEVAHGTTPTDTFQEKVEPYVQWATTEYVVLDGSEHLKVEPLTLNDPFPCTRSGFYKASFLVKAKEGTDFEKFYAHWLKVHLPNVLSTLKDAGGFRYVVSHSIEPELDAYAGLAELYFHDDAGWTAWKNGIQPDGMEEWIDPAGTISLGGCTEMIGIP